MTVLPSAAALTGQLFVYAANNNRVAFESLPLSANKCILLGGLSDGLLPVPYVTALSELCTRQGWSLVQPLFSSSYTGFGIGSLDQDVIELDELIVYLQQHRHCQRVCCVGHSTGCQDIVHYLKTQQRHRLDGAVLQAPVSDREHASMSPEYEPNLQLAQEMRTTGQLDELMPRNSLWAPITVSRYLDLNERGGNDDYFSSDFSDAELVDRLRHVGTSCDNVLVAYSGSDEYVPPTVDSQQLVYRLVAAMNTDASLSARALYLPHANHNLSQGPVDLFLESVEQLLKRVT